MNRTLKDIQTMVFEEYIKNGYLEEWTNHFSNDVNSPLQKKLDIAELGLVLTEISEAIEEIRNNYEPSDNLYFECADVIIRILNFMSKKGANSEFFIINKHEKNLKRGKLHGKQV